jgi:hypothetical protein
MTVMGALIVALPQHLPEEQANKKRIMLVKTVHPRLSCRKSFYRKWRR